MEVIKFDFPTRELSRELLTEGFTKKIDCTKYWDSHGKKTDWDPEYHSFSEPKKFEIWKVITEWDLPYTGKCVNEYWHLYIDGEELNLGEIMKYEVLKTKLKLVACAGTG